MGVNGSLIRYDEHKIAQFEYSADDIEYYLLNAYKRVYFSKRPPEFWDISDAFREEVLDNGQTMFSFENMVLHKNEITEEMLEFILAYTKCEFISMMGEHLNDCQNILFEEMI